MPSQPVAMRSGDALSANISSGRVVLAIDYGRRRIGLALSDALGITARPLNTLVRINRRRDLARLREVCREHGVAAILVGLPLHMDGTRGEMAEEAARFGERVQKALGLPVELVDERLSSWEAEQFPSAQDPRRHMLSRAHTPSRTYASSRKSTRTAPGKSRGKRPLDELAAAVILRDYLSRDRGGRQI